MSDVDTSAEAVERLAAAVAEGARAFGGAANAVTTDDMVAAFRGQEVHQRNLAATLRALLAERDEAITRGNDWCDQAQKARAERDRYAEREMHFARKLRVADGGQYRHDWDAAIRSAFETGRGEAQAEAARLRRGWLTTIQVENSCPATGGGCLSKRCDCVAEMERLMRQDDVNHRPRREGARP